eukprot:4319337-Pyramimonas_sp.AAC.1
MNRCRGPTSLKTFGFALVPLLLFLFLPPPPRPSFHPCLCFPHQSTVSARRSHASLPHRGLRRRSHCYQPHESPPPSTALCGPIRNSTEGPNGTFRMRPHHPVQRFVLI